MLEPPQKLRLEEITKNAILEIFELTQKLRKNHLFLNFL